MEMTIAALATTAVAAAGFWFGPASQKLKAQIALIADGDADALRHVSRYISDGYVTRGAALQCRFRIQQFVEHRWATAYLGAVRLAPRTDAFTVTVPADTWHQLVDVLQDLGNHHTWYRGTERGADLNILANAIKYGVPFELGDGSPDEESLIWLNRTRGLFIKYGFRHAGRLPAVEDCVRLLDVVLGTWDNPLRIEHEPAFSANVAA